MEPLNNGMDDFVHYRGVFGGKNIGWYIRWMVSFIQGVLHVYEYSECPILEVPL